jgi:single-stranded-DNA-specific exonuclease
MKKRWDVLEPCPPEFAAACGDVHPVVPQLLWHRGVRDYEDAESFFHPSYERGLHDPFLFSQMRAAAERILRSLRDGERILVFGDYDADGLSGSAIVVSAVREIAKSTGSSSEVRTYIPHREDEGYGLQMVQAERMIGEGYGLVITVDCGIACPEEIARLRECGIDVIVVDHHGFGDALPDAVLIHPGLPGETYPFKHLAAAGVAWKLACALIACARERGTDVPEGFEKWLLDLAAIATVTDVVPLTGENRVLEHFGLKVLNKTRRPGLRAIIGSASLSPGRIRARDLGFVIGPRLNAPSRMAHASVAMDILLSEDEDHAHALARQIESLNRSRQEAMLVMMREADELLEESSGADARMHALWLEHWSPSLAGLVAGRIADRFGVPTIAMGKHGDQWIGSGRSFQFYDITEAVKRAGQGLITRAGGHAQACGFALDSEELVREFVSRLRADARERIEDGMAGPFLEVHADLDLKDADWRIVESLERFEPFGCGNPEPVFRARNVEVVSASAVGRDGRHLRMAGKSSDGSVRPFIAFGFADRADEARPGSVIDVAYNIGTNEWNGNREIQCKVKDIRPAG